ncbi:MAG TPA: pitrilysin family protein [Gemmatimonadales bacterium]|nr:pitrilysin family protein [Gemmatimonadales bacterium]
MTDEQGPGRWSGGVRREVLPNGLTVLVQRDASAPVVAVVTHVKAGFFDEPDRWGGISHVLEHMFFKGTARRGVGAVARETKAAGGYLNASTGYDQTNYFVVLPREGLASALEIQADALRNAALDGGELARELQVIIQEAKRKLDSPEAVAAETLHEVMFDRHRIRRWRIGREEDLARFTRDDVRGYYESRYVPERTIVAIVGDVDPEAALALAREAYGGWPPRPGALDRSPEEPPHRGVRARTLRGDVAQAQLVIGWPTVPPLHPDSPALDLAAAVLSAGRGSWLYRALREPGIVSGIASWNYAPTELGVFAVSADLEPERLPAAVEGIAEATARLGMLGPSEPDLTRARTLVLARWARRLESMEGRASALAAAEALGGVEILDREYDALQTATADDVRAVAARYLAPDNVSGVAYLPRGRGADLTVEMLARAFAVTALRPLASPAGSAPRAAGPRAAQARERDAGVWQLALPGVDVLVRRKIGVPMVALGIYVPRLEFDPPGEAGIGALTVRGALRGAGALDAAGLAFAVERLGGTLGASSTVDWLGVGTAVLAERLPEAGALLDLVYTAPRFGEAEIAAERDLMIVEATQVADDMFRYPFQLAFGAAFGDLTYGRPIGGLAETLAGLTAGDARRWHERALLGVRPVVVAVGDVEPERAAEQLAGVFGAYPQRARAMVTAPVAWALDSRPLVRAVEREKAQSALAMVFQGPDRRAPDRWAGDVWAAIASGLGGRLFEALRDRRSLAYTVVASSWQKGRAGALVTYIATSPDREEEARSAMLAELERFVREPASEEELRQAVSYLAGQVQVRLQSGAAVAGDILEAWLVGDGLGELADPAARYRAVTADAVRAVAAHYLDAARRAEGVVRGTRGRR